MSLPKGATVSCACVSPLDFVLPTEKPTNAPLVVTKVVTFISPADVTGLAPFL